MHYGTRSRFSPRRRSSPNVDYSTLLFNTNNLLSAAGISAKKIKTIGELTRVSSSMFVAVFESIFHVRVEGIIRAPQTKDDYVLNVQRVIDGLGEQIEMDLQHIKGRAIVEGDVRSLSNLIHIFIRIIHITGSQESQSTDPAYGASAPQRDGDANSISTKDSDLNGGGGGDFGGFQDAGAGGDAAFAQQQPLTADKIRRLCEQDARQLLLTTEVQIQQSERTEAARVRRETQLSARESRCGAANRKTEEVARMMRQKRWIEECIRSADSYKLRQNNEEHTMLRKIYRGLMQKLHSWRRAERQEAKENVSRMRDEAKSYIQSLQVLFEDRVRLLKEQTHIRKRDNGVHEHAQRSMGAKLKHAYANDHKAVLESQTSVLTQKRQAQLLKEREGHRSLLSILAVEKWEDSLRSDN